MDMQCSRRRNFMSLGLVVLSVFVSAWPVLGSTFTVTNTSDSGAGSLRDAVVGASNGDTINFALSYPRPPRSRAAPFKSLYRKRANTPCSCARLAPRASDTALGLIGSWLVSCGMLLLSH